ncbi:unnamed protein product [Sympodiomycopsis kandeliae]
MEPAVTEQSPADQPVSSDNGEVSESLKAIANQKTSEGETSTNKLTAQLAKAQEYKAQGNKLYAEGDRQGAKQAWHFTLLHSSGINALANQYGGQNSQEEIATAQSITVAAHNNLASCYMAEEKWDKVVVSANKVISLDEKNVKAYYRRAKAWLKLNHIQRAADDLDKAMEISPDDPSVNALAKQIVQEEERKLAISRSKMGGFLKGKILGTGQEYEIHVQDKGEGGATSSSGSDSHDHSHHSHSHGHQHDAKLEEVAEEAEGEAEASKQQP